MEGNRRVLRGRLRKGRRGSTLRRAATGRWGPAVAALALVLGAAACTGRTADAIAGARLYAAGTESLVAGRSAQAVRELTRAARRVPEASEIRNHLGLAYWSLGRTEEARRAFERALALDCDNRLARRNLARLESGAPAPRSARDDDDSRLRSRREGPEAARAGSE